MAHTHTRAEIEAWQILIKKELAQVEDGLR